MTHANIQKFLARFLTFLVFYLKKLIINQKNNNKQSVPTKTKLQ